MEHSPVLLIYILEVFVERRHSLFYITRLSTLLALFFFFPRGFCISIDSIECFLWVLFNVFFDVDLFCVFRVSITTTNITWVYKKVLHQIYSKPHKILLCTQNSRYSFSLLFIFPEKMCSLNKTEPFFILATIAFFCVNLVWPKSKNFIFVERVNKESVFFRCFFTLQTMAYDRRPPCTHSQEPFGNA